MATDPTIPDRPFAYPFLAAPTQAGELGRLGPYRVLTLLGAGGMGIVFEAEDAQLERRVALKVLAPALAGDPAARRRFVREARAAAALEHDHIVPIYEVGEDHGTPYLAMALLRGESLETRLARDGALTISEAVRIGRETAAGLAAAHERGLIHRDIKPANLWLEAQTGRVRILDFGLVRATADDDSLSQLGLVIGTPGYFAPEQARGGAADARCDLFSLGCVLYHLTTGAPPYRAGSLLSALAALALEVPAAPRERNPQVPPELSALILQLLARNPAERPQSARVVVAALTALAQAPARPARGPGLPRSARAVVRWLLTAMLLAAVGYAAWEGFGRFQAHRLRDRLLACPTDAVPEVVEEMARYRRWLDPLLWEADAEARAQGAGRQQLHVSLALLPIDAGQVEYLYERLLQAEPRELRVIRAALFEHRHDLTERLWSLLATPHRDQDQRLRAAAALAWFAPDDPRWQPWREVVVERLVRQAPATSSAWAEAFRPVAEHLLPPLAAALADDRRQQSELPVLVRLYQLLADGQPTALAKLLAPADAKDAPAGVAPVVLARRRARVAAALVALGHGEPSWPLLKHSADPTLRSLLIERLADSGVPARALLARFEHEPDVSSRRALLLSLGAGAVERLSADEQVGFLPWLRRLYRDDPDPGLHGAVGWLLRQQQAADTVQQVDQELATGQPEGGRRWYVNRQGQTLMVLDKPGAIWLAANGLPRHRRQIERRVALASREVSVAEFLRFRPDHVYWKEIAPTDDCPVNGVTWYDTAAYCNWLSAREGLPPEQWCYLPNEAGKYDAGMRMAPEYLHRTGYRLPTEAEWDYACRAGADTTWFFGDATELLGKYAWHFSRAAHPGGLLRPNDFGLCDMHGNLAEYTHDALQPLPPRADGAAVDDGEAASDLTAITNAVGRVLRGGSFPEGPDGLYCGVRGNNAPNTRFPNAGFRPARTLPPE